MGGFAVGMGVGVGGGGITLFVAGGKRRAAIPCRTAPVNLRWGLGAGGRGQSEVLHKIHSWQDLNTEQRTRRIGSRQGE